MVMYTVEQAAELFRVKPVTILRWLRAGRLKGSKLTHQVWRITEAQVQAFMDSTEQEGKAPKGEEAKIR